MATWYGELCVFHKYYASSNLSYVATMHKTLITFSVKIIVKIHQGEFSSW
jgi:hypothetical protein